MDVQAIAAIVHSYPGVILVVDSTFCSPFNQSPMSLGADIVVHSVTKYLSGHCDVVMGVAVMNDPALHQELKFLQNAFGGVPSPFDCFLAHRGLKTLHVRMKRHNENGLRIAQCLEASPLVERVIYPGLPSHPQHALALRQQPGGCGGMVSFCIRSGNLASSNLFLTSLALFTLAESLGGVESLAELPAVMTHASVSPEQRAALGVTDNLIRLSVGLEEAEDLVRDVEQALQKAAASLASK